MQQFPARDMDGPCRPEHACAVLVDGRGRLALQLRPPWLRHAAGRLACYGGKREAHETPAQCLARELAEETGWRPPLVSEAGIDLHCGQRHVARFITLALPPGIVLRPEPGFVDLRVDPRTLPGLPLSPWHRAALAAWLVGLTALTVAEER